MKSIYKNKFENDIPNYILDLLEKIVLTKANIIISGETDTGKTELQRLLLSFINVNDRIITIEDKEINCMKELFPEKNIYTKFATCEKSISNLVRESLKNSPNWIIVSQIYDNKYQEIVKAILTGHFVITTVQANNIYEVSNNIYEVSQNVYMYKSLFDFGISINKLKIEDKIIKYLNEIVEFTENGAITVFKQNYVNGKFVYENGVLSDEFKERMDEKGISFQFPVEEIEEDTTESLDEVREVVKN
ncbi:TPA: Flp pilus assembly complex ATPase component TadA [Clostridium botulinum]|nr:Flp pilus assembly complex ATPase component TadA [Clostridium botulinum]